MIPVRDVRSVLHATAILFAFAIIGMRGAFVWLEYRYAIARAEASTQDLTRLMEEYTKRTLETSDLLLKDITAYVQSKGGVEPIKGSREAHDFLVEMTRQSSGDDLFAIIDRTGAPAAMSGSFPPRPISFAGDKWFKAHRAGADTIVGDAALGAVIDEIYFTYTRGIPDMQGEFDGVVQIALRPNFLQELSRSTASAADLVLGIWGRDGNVIARTGLGSDSIDASIGRSRIFSTLAGQKPGIYRSSETADGAERIVAFRRLDRWPITVTASIPVATALAAWTEGLYWSAAVIAVMLVAIGSLTWFGIRLSYRTEETQRHLHDLNHALEKTNSQLETALDDKSTLLKEIHHRVKNNLQVTSSLLQLQSRRFDDPEVRAAFQETQDRLQSIGLIHDTLYRTDTGGTVNLKEYFERLIADLSATYGAQSRNIKVSLDAKPVFVDLEQTVPLALAVTEAISNAFKHAFESSHGGEIRVSIHRAVDGLEITVRDSGRGLEGITERPGSLGTKLMRAFASQLGATISMETNGGTVFRLFIPDEVEMSESRALADSG